MDKLTKEEWSKLNELIRGLSVRTVVYQTMLLAMEAGKYDSDEELYGAVKAAVKKYKKLVKRCE